MHCFLSLWSHSCELVKYLFTPGTTGLNLCFSPSQGTSVKHSAVSHLWDRDFGSPILKDLMKEVLWPWWTALCWCWNTFSSSSFYATVWWLLPPPQNSCSLASNADLWCCILTFSSSMRNAESWVLRLWPRWRHRIASKFHSINQKLGLCRCCVWAHHVHPWCVPDHATAPKSAISLWRGESAWADDSYWSLQTSVMMGSWGALGRHKPVQCFPAVKA